jgi:hypothetical protein
MAVGNYFSVCDQLNVSKDEQSAMLDTAILLIISVGSLFDIMSNLFRGFPNIRIAFESRSLQIEIYPFHPFVERISFSMERTLMDGGS